VVAIMAAMAILLTVAVQTASFQMRREREEELIFRGRQIVEGIRVFRARNGRFPGSLVELAEADPRVVRKVWKDPVTRATDWVPIFLGQEGTSPTGPAAGQPPPTPAPTPGPTPKAGPAAFPPTEATGPVVGVHSRSCEKSIKVVDGRERYCDWKFVFDPQKVETPRSPSKR